MPRIFLVFCTKKQSMHRTLVNVVPMDYEEYEAMMLDMPQDADVELQYRGNGGNGGRGARIAVAGNFPVPTITTPNKTMYATPWRRSSCAMCASELDCRLSDEYCGTDGCCHKGECEQDADCLEQDALNQYYRINNYDSLGFDINPLNPQNDLTITQKLCDVNPSCVGFNSYGLLKYDIVAPSLWTPQPPVDDLVPWTLYIKKTATMGKKPKVVLPRGVNQFCTETAPPSPLVAVPKGRCHQCLGCEADGDCPDGTVCDTVAKCCVNNPCYVASAEDGQWVDGRYTREAQCLCAADEPYCCLNNIGDTTSAFCSRKPCEAQDKVRACSYICEDPHKQHDAVMCKANERCCNQQGGPPMCCAPDSDCDVSAQENACVAGPVARAECKGGPGFSSAFCRPSQVCCNSALNAAPTCCSHPSLGCYTGGDVNGCNYSDLPYYRK
jgi:hypothetical protein